MEAEFVEAVSSRWAEQHLLDSQPQGMPLCYTHVSRPLARSHTLCLSAVSACLVRASACISDEAC